MAVDDGQGIEEDTGVVYKRSKHMGLVQRFRTELNYIKDKKEFVAITIYHTGVTEIGL